MAYASEPREKVPRLNMPSKDGRPALLWTFINYYYQSREARLVSPERRSLLSRSLSQARRVRLKLINMVGMEKKKKIKGAEF